MSKIAVILAQPMEYNTSSMIRCSGIINALFDAGHAVTCYMPNADVNSRYYGKATIHSEIDVKRYGRISTVRSIDAIRTAGHKNIKSMIKRLAYRVFKKFDVFGSSLLYLPERKQISEDIIGSIVLLVGGFQLKAAWLLRSELFKEETPYGKAVSRM